MNGSPSSVLTLGLGSWGSTGLLLTLGLGIEAVSPVTLVGTWSNVIEVAGSNFRTLEITSGNPKSIDV